MPSERQLHPSPALPNRVPRSLRRGVALLLVMIAVIVSAIVAYSYLAAESTSIQIARNIRDHEAARYVAETGLDIALAAVRTQSDWRTRYPNGQWAANVAVPGGICTISGEDGVDGNGDGRVEGDGNLANHPDDPLTLTVTGRAGSCTHVARAVVTPDPVNPGKYLVDYADGTRGPYYFYAPPAAPPPPPGGPPSARGRHGNRSGDGNRNGHGGGGRNDNGNGNGRGGHGKGRGGGRGH